MIVGRSVSKNSDRMTWHSEWMPRHEKFSEKSLWALSSWNRMWDGVESEGEEEEDALEWRGFWDEVDFCLGVIEQLTRESEREKWTNKKAPNSSIYAWKMHEHVICNIKSIMGSAQPKSTSTQHFNIVITHLKCMNIVKTAHVMQCMMI